MRIRWWFELIIVSILTPVLLIPSVYKNIIIFFNLCNSVIDEKCIEKSTSYLFLFWIIFVIFILATIEIIFYLIRKKKEKTAFNTFDNTTSPYEVSLYVENKSYPKISDCSVKLHRVNVINKKGCRRIFDSETCPDKTPKLFLWENDNEIKDLINGGTIKIFGAGENERVFILTKKNFECNYIFTNRRSGKSARKAVYEIEIEISGSARFDNVESTVKKMDCWRIFYSYKNHFTSQKVYIEKIDKLQEPNDLDLGQNLGNKKSFSVAVYPVSNK